MILFALVRPAAGLPSGDQGDELVAVPPEFPTEVVIDVGVNDIPSIDEREQLFEIDGTLSAFWIDERLAFDPAEFGAESKVYQGEVAAEKLKTEVWWPDFELVDGRGARETIALALSVDFDGLVVYQERFLATVAQPFLLQEFPFDEHDISLHFESFTQGIDRVVFLSLDDVFADVDEPPPDLSFAWDDDEWSVSGGEEPPEIVNDEDSGFAGATISVSISRNSGFYMTNIVLPLLLIVSISFAVFWMDLETMTLADRLGVSITSLLTVVAFDFVTGDLLPKLPYSTRLDVLYTVSYVFVALTVVTSMIAYWKHRTGDEKAVRTAGRLDRRARWVIPLGYGLAVTASLTGALN